MPQTNPAKFLSEVKNELTKVTWPTRQEVVRLTIVVVIISLVVGLFIGGLDFLFTKGIQFFLGR
ncbi:preprotein translocase subunit SecE [Patescibacteria group bacterium]|nr:preprotein translocase subunit SecE [Patescibacteria group bacterium]